VINVKEDGWNKERFNKWFKVNNDPFLGCRNSGWRYRYMRDWKCSQK